MQHSASVRRGRAKEIPFGVRALEKGVEVDGVWNSGVTTPATSVPGSPVLSANNNKGKAPRDPSQDGSSAFTLNKNHGKAQRPSSRPSSAAIEKSGGRATYQPRHSSGLRFSNSHEHDDLEAQSPQAEDQLDVDSPPENRQSASWSGSSSNSTEQDIVNTPADFEGSVSTDGRLYSSSYSVSLNTSQNPHENNPFLTPTMSRGSPDGIIPLAHLDDLVPSDDTRGSATYHAQMLDSAEIAYDDGHAQPIRPFEASRQTRKSQVVRKVNSGFEILRSGTLDRSRQTSDIGTEWREERHSKKSQPRKLQRKKRGDSAGGASLRH